jgi:hypothetical protein
MLIQSVHAGFSKSTEQNEAEEDSSLKLLVEYVNIENGLALAKVTVSRTR